MSGGDVWLRLVRRRGEKVVRRWEAPVAPDDQAALAGEFLTAVRAVVRATSDREAEVFLPDYRLEIFAVVGGWTVASGRS